MKHPALTRMMGIFLAVVSLVTVAAGGLGFRGAKKDHLEQGRQAALLKTRIGNVEALLSELDALQAEYDAAEEIVAERRAGHDKDRSGYRTELGTYTATKAGVVLGRRQLDDTAEMLRQSMEMFQIGLSQFLEIEAAFQPIYELYLGVRGSMDEALAIYNEASASLPRGGTEEDPSFSPEQVLALADAEHRLYAQMGELLRQQQAGLAPDQHQAADLLKQALQDYEEIAPELEGFSVERLAYQAGLEVYDRAASALDAEAGDDARAAADQICRDSFGMDFAELGDWLTENEPAPVENEGGDTLELTPEMLDQLLEAVPNDAALIGTALGLIDESDQSLSEKEAAYRADPYSVSAAELLLGVSKEGLDGSERLLGLVEPVIVETHDQLQFAHEQLDAAWYAIYSAQQTVKENYETLEETSADLDGQRKELEEKRAALESDLSELEELERRIEAYERVQGRLHSQRAELLGDEEIYQAVDAGGELIETAKAELERRSLASEEEHQTRRILCAVMVAAGVFGLITALGAFEKPRIRRLWLPLLCAVLLAGAGELISFRLGRGLWYSAVFILIFGVLTFPLTIGNRKEGFI